jgi:hypothetical protein
MDFDWGSFVFFLMLRLEGGNSWVGAKTSFCMCCDLIIRTLSHTSITNATMKATRMASHVLHRTLLDVAVAWQVGMDAIFFRRRGNRWFVARQSMQRR